MKNKPMKNIQIEKQLGLVKGGGGQNLSSEPPPPSEKGDNPKSWLGKCLLERK